MTVGPSLFILVQRLKPDGKGYQLFQFGETAIQG